MVSRDFPEELKEFLEKNNVPVEVFEVELPRYVRVNPRNTPEKAAFLRELEQTNITECWVTEVSEHFWKIPKHLKIANCESYKQGKLYGMDLSSGASVLALQLEPNDSVADLCCAPGAKLLFINDLLERGSITGIDVSHERLNVTRALLKKYQARQDIHLECQDATTWVPKTTFSKVLVDAECTHEGSIKHLEKFSKQWGWESFKRRVLETHEGLKELQRRLLAKGCQVVKSGGRVVYSTCSFCTNQNEDIVEWALSTFPEMQLVSVDLDLPHKKVGCYLKFDPLTSECGGQFIAVLEKI